jgi:hypothetical protein
MHAGMWRTLAVQHLVSMIKGRPPRAQAHLAQVHLADMGKEIDGPNQANLLVLFVNMHNPLMMIMMMLMMMMMMMPCHHPQAEAILNR